ncbi:MAG: protein-L-isoaspartate O-methyltransferase [Candidatus Levybacteria bacterium]|nr:protein-L-isoaspartate O-methyltransferase [Candidatus Levybacteria bacterium]
MSLDELYIPGQHPKPDIDSLVIFNPDAFVDFGTHVEPAPADSSPVPRQVMMLRILERLGEGRVLDAFTAIDRADFVPPASRAWAYSEVAIPLTQEAAISRPTMVARMIDGLDLTGSENVLEVGTGLGYGAAVLSRLAARVHTVEIDPELAAKVRRKLKRLGFENVTVHTGDGLQGLPGEAPFDAILVTGGVERTPQPLRDQLAVGGRIVVPAGLFHDQRLWAGKKQPDGTIPSVNMGGVVFKPLLRPASVAG